ncbi:MAG TPA: ATP-binding protein [Dongiaceae bacterium]|nr:ATP-binding protein [Dongiaceae bacterium]
MYTHIQKIIRGLANASGEPAFQRFVSCLAEAVGADWVFIGRVDNTLESLTTLAYYADGHIQSNISMPLAGTPCHRVIQGNACLFEKDLATLFPDFGLLKQSTFTGYAGIAIRGSERQPLGVLSCLFRNPIPEPRETLELMDLFASRIGGEIERIESVRALGELNQQLEEKVAERTAQLLQANAELETFCHSISHDLRAPLRAIRGFSQALEEDYGSQLDENAHRFLQRIQTNAQTMSLLLTDLLSLSRLASQAVQPVRVNLADMLPAMISELREKFPQLQVNTRIAPQLMVIGDRGMLRLLLNHLAANAFKFARQDAGLELELGVTDWDSQPALFLRDNGSGIPSTRIPDAFKPFARFHNDPLIDGNGIGLATCKRIVGKHLGRIQILPNPSHGITVRFTLQWRPDATALPDAGIDGSGL